MLDSKFSYQNSINLILDISNDVIILQNIFEFFCKLLETADENDPTNVIIIRRFINKGIQLKNSKINLFLLPDEINNKNQIVCTNQEACDIYYSLDFLGFCENKISHDIEYKKVAILLDVLEADTRL